MVVLQNDVSNLKLVEVGRLPLNRPGYVDCGEVTGCPYNAIRLNILGADKGTSIFCSLCKAVLRCRMSRGGNLRWTREEKTPAEVAQDQEEASISQQKLANPVWDELRHMQEQHREEKFVLENQTKHVKSKPHLGAPPSDHPCLSCKNLAGYFWRPIGERGTAGQWHCSICDPWHSGEEVQVTAGIDRPVLLTRTAVDWSDEPAEPDLFDER